MKPRLFIIEGPDCTGKTTLAKNLCYTTKGFYFHCTASKTLFPALPDYHTNILHNVTWNVIMGNTIVLDRFWPSEVVYGGMFRPDSGYQDTAHVLDETVKELNGRYIFCTSDKAYSRFCSGMNDDDPAHKLTKEQYLNVFRGYQKLCLSMLPRKDTFVYDLEVDGQSPKALANFIERITT